MKKIIASSVATLAISSAASAETRIESFKTTDVMDWNLRQPSSSKEEQRRQVALDTCAAKVAADINTSQSVLESIGATISYSDLSIASFSVGGSKTKGVKWGSAGKHEVWGTVSCSYYLVTTLP